MAKPTPPAAPPGPTISVPTISTEEICAAATRLAARAKERLLAGAAAEGASLAGKAIELAQAVGHAAVDELEKLEEVCLRFAGNAEQPPIGSPAAPQSTQTGDSTPAA